MKKKSIIANAVIIVIYLIIIFIFHPNLNPLYGGGLAFWGLLITVYALFLLIRGGAVKIKDTFTGTVSMDRGALRHKKALIITAIAPWAILIVVGIVTVPLFFWPAYRGQMPAAKARKFSSDVQPLDVKQLPVVDSALATRLADKMLGEKPALGSQVTIGNPTIQKVNGKLVWAVPLLHSGFFKWLSNLGGTPGYILVSATDQRNVRYVPNYNIKYQPNGYLLDNLYRHARLDGGFFSGLTDYSFEIDDSGRPYWVVTTYHNTLGFSLPEADGILLIDAQTGKTVHYSLKDVPKWVDRVQPEDFVMNQLNNRGKYIHGVFNFSNKDKFQTSNEDVIVYNRDHCYLFTCITSVGNDESATGFMLVDMVTKRQYLYNMSGATEYAAQQSAEGKVQNQKYKASFPIITNVQGKATYFMTLKDNAGLIKQYAFVPVGDYTIVGIGDTMQDALDDLSRNVHDTDGGDISTGSTVSIEGTISRIAPEDQSGSTVYKMILSEQPGRIFTAPFDLSGQLALTHPGDKVQITFDKKSSGVTDLTAFKNETIDGQ